MADHLCNDCLCPYVSKSDKKPFTEEDNEEESHDISVSPSASRPEHTSRIARLVQTGKAVSFILKTKSRSGHSWYTVRRLRQNKQKITEVLVAALFFFIIFGQTDVTNVAATTKSMSSRQRQQDNVLTWVQCITFFFCYCCCWTKWEIFQFEMLLWISVSTVREVQSKHCCIHTHERACAVGTFKADSPCGSKFWAVHRGVHADPSGP